MSFDQKKSSILSSPPFAPGRDLSPKGSLDAPILECVAFINQLSDYVTTSSCSGRISIYQNNNEEDTKGVTWLCVRHGEITLDDIINSVTSLEEEKDNKALVMVKCEGFILHVLSRNIAAASLLHQVELIASLI